MAWASRTMQKKQTDRNEKKNSINRNQIEMKIESKNLLKLSIGERLKLMCVPHNRIIYKQKRPYFFWLIVVVVVVGGGVTIAAGCRSQ